MSNEVYTDLERERFDNVDKYLDTKLKLDIIATLSKQCPDDCELGAKVREFINLQQDTL